jgi:hypothetical protein
MVEAQSSWFGNINGIQISIGGSIALISAAFALVHFDIHLPDIHVPKDFTLKIDLTTTPTPAEVPASPVSMEQPQTAPVEVTRPMTPIEQGFRQDGHSPDGDTWAHLRSKFWPSDGNTYHVDASGDIYRENADGSMTEIPNRKFTEILSKYPPVTQ